MERRAAIITAALFIALAAAVFQPAGIRAQQAEQFSLNVVNLAEDEDFLDKVAKEKKKEARKEAFSLEDLPAKIPRDHWIYNAIEFLVKEGVIDADLGWSRIDSKQISDSEISRLLDLLLEHYDQLVAEGIIQPSDRVQPPSTVKVVPSQTIVNLRTVEKVVPEKVMGAQPVSPPSTAAISGKANLLAAAPKKTPLPPVWTVAPLAAQNYYYNPLALPAPVPQDIRRPVAAAGANSVTLDSSGLPIIVPGPYLAPPNPKQPASAPRANSAPADLRRGNLKSMEAPAEKVKETAPAASEKNDKEDVKEKKEDKKEEKKSVKVPKEFSKLEKKVDLTEKDVEILEAVMEYIEKDVIKKEVSKDISDVKKVAQTNERDIQKLEEQNQRFKVTGSATVQYERTTKNYKLKDLGTSTHPGEPSGTPWKSFSTNLYSKPRRFDDMTLRTALTSSSDLKLSYQDFTVDKENPRNFKLRTIYAGRMGFGASPLTTLGRDMDGFYTELKLNDYSLKGAIGTHSGDSNIFINAVSLQFNLFGEARSWAYISRISSYNKRNSSIDSIKRWGWWNGGDDSVVMPPEKNSVVSFYMRYPMPVEGMYMTAEYAHSTYSRKGFKLGFPQSATVSTIVSCLERRGDYCYYWDDYWTYGHDFSYENAFTGWIPIPEIRDQDDSFFILLDYNKGPLQIFPMGYVRLGSKFVSKYLGLPGFSTDDLGLDMIPINLQSLELMVLMGNYKKLEDNYKWDFLAVSGGETKPMYLDTSAMGADMGTIIQFNLIGRLNNRPPESKLKFTYVQNKFTYYMSDDITFSAQYSTVKALLPETCLDGNYTKVKDDYGNFVGAYFGNGISNCDQNSPNFDEEDLLLKLRFTMNTEKYNLFWRTSKKSEVSFDYGIENTRMAVLTSVDTITEAISTLVPQGAKYYTKFNFKYRLTDVSSLGFWYNKDFPREGLGLANPDSVFQETVGVKIDMSY